MNNRNNAKQEYDIYIMRHAMRRYLTICTNGDDKNSMYLHGPVSRRSWPACLMRATKSLDTTRQTSYQGHRGLNNVRIDEWAK